MLDTILRRCAENKYFNGKAAGIVLFTETKLKCLDSGLGSELLAELIDWSRDLSKCSH